MNIKKTLCFILIACLIWNLSLSAEGISTKLRGKIALAGILSGLAYLTHTLVKRDIHAAENLQTQLGPPERITQFERGFDQWNVLYYRKHSYFFLNNRFIRKKTHKAFFLHQTSPEFLKRDFITYHSSNWDKLFSPSPTDTPVSVNPRWLSLYLLHQRQVLEPVSLYPCQLEVGRLPVPHLWHPRLR